MKIKFLNVYTVLGVLFIIIQQAIVATSTALIAQLSQSIMTGGNHLFWLTMFVLSLTIVYIPTLLTNLFINKARYFTYYEYISKFCEVAYNSPNRYFNASFRKEKETYFSHESWLIIQENYSFIVNVFSVVLNVLFNVIVLSFYLDWAFLVSYAVAIPLTSFCVIFSKSRLQRKSDKLQKSRNEMMQTINQGWDTILIGNMWNVSIWKQRFVKRCTLAGSSQRKLTLEIDIASTITLVVSSFPILIVLFNSFIRASDDVQMLAMLVATAPRQVLTIQYLSDIIGLFVNLNDKLRRTRQLSANLDFDKMPAGDGGRIAWGNLYIENKKGRVALNAFDDLVAATSDFTKGRYTIVGDNGAGKTTLLSLIKLELHDKAFLLPSQSKMAFLNDDDKEYSTGEKTVANLGEIFNHTNDAPINVLLLDEWNANLDKVNIDNTNRIIDKLSESICVIEVLHKDA